MSKILATHPSRKAWLPWTERLAERFVETRDFEVLDGCTNDELPDVLACAAMRAPHRHERHAHAVMVPLPADRPARRMHAVVSPARRRRRRDGAA